MHAYRLWLRSDVSVWDAGDDRGTRSNETRYHVIMLMQSLQFLKWYEKYTTMHLQQNIIVDTINYISISQIRKLQQTNCSEVFFLFIIHMES